MRLDHPRDRKRVPGRFEHDLILCAKALRKQLQPCRRRLDPSSQTHPSVLGDRNLAEVAVHIERDDAHPYLLSLTGRGDEAGKTTTTDPCSRHTRAVAGAANYKQRARSP